MYPSEAWAIVGPAGRYQIFLSSILCLSKVFVAIQICAPVLTEMKPEAAEEALGKNNKVTSIRTEFAVGDHIAEFSKSIFWIGVIAGNSFLGSCGDKYGRKFMLIITFLCNILVSCLTGLALNWQLYFLGRLLSGFFQGGMFVIVFILNNEFFDKSYWAIAGAVINGSWGVGFVVLSKLGHIWPNWRELQIYSALVFLPLVLVIWIIIPESPLWLCSVNRHSEAEVILRKMAKYNGRPVKGEKAFMKIQNLQPEKENSVNLTQSISKAIYNNEYRSRLKCATISWFVCGITAYYLTYSADHLGGTVYDNLSYQGVVEIFIDLSVAIIFKTFRRKPALTSLWLLNILMLLFMATSPLFLPIMRDSTSVYRLIFAMLTKGAIAAVFCSFWIYTSELFPTSLRSGSQGLCSMCARFGAMLSPLLFEFGDSIPLYLLAGMGVLAMVYGYYLPETYGQRQIDRLEDLIRYSRVKNKSSKVDEYKQILLNSDDDTNYELANISDNPSDEVDVGSLQGGVGLERGLLGDSMGSPKKSPKNKRRRRSRSYSPGSSASGSDSSDNSGDSDLSNGEINYVDKKKLNKKGRDKKRSSSRRGYKNTDTFDVRNEETARMNEGFDDSNIDDTPRKQHSWI